MSNRQFNRTASVIFGTVGAEVLSIKDASITFSLNKTATPESNKGSVQIHNLSKRSRDKIRELDQVVTVSAGYVEAGGLEVIYIGDIVSITHNSTKPNTITRIEVNDGEKILRESTLSVSYKEGFSVRQILTDIASKLAVPQRVDIAGLQFQDKTFSSGYAFIGQAKDILDTLTKTVGLEWSFQNNELKIQLAGSGDASRSIVVNESTGLIGSPEPLKNTGRNSDAAVVKPGWIVKTLLQPRAEPGGLITLTSREIPTPTVFRIDEVEHRGSTYERDWISTMKILEL